MDAGALPNRSLLENERIVDTRKPSLLGESAFWVGIALIVIAILIFLVTAFFMPKYNYTIGFLLKFISINASILSSLPAGPTVLEIIGLLYVVYAELAVYFKEYIITNYRIMYKRGVISKDINIMMPDKISDVSVDISIKERLLGLGSVIIRLEEVSKPQIAMSAINDPYGFQNGVLKLINKETFGSGAATKADVSGQPGKRPEDPYALGGQRNTEGQKGPSTGDDDGNN